MVVLYSPRLCCLAGSSSTPAIVPRPERHTLLQAEVRTNDECAGDAHHCQHTSSTTHTATAQGRLLTLACGFHRLAELRSATVSGVVVNGRHPVSVANGCHNPGCKDPSHTTRCLHHSIHRIHRKLITASPQFVVTGSPTSVCTGAQSKARSCNSVRAVHARQHAMDAPHPLATLQVNKFTRGSPTLASDGSGGAKCLPQQPPPRC